jgi:hypothetical protein
MLMLGLGACERTPPQPAAQAPVPVPSWTKAVRLIVVPDGQSKGQALRAFVEKERAAKNDIFIVGSSPMSYVNGELVEHAQAVMQDAEALPFVSARVEQIQWQSDHDFEISGIEKSMTPLKTIRRGQPWVIDRNDAAPAVPFAALKAGARGGPNRPVRSGAPVDVPSSGHLYSVRLSITVNGQRRDLSPAVYLFVCGSASGCIVGDAERRGAEASYRDAVVSTLPNRTKVVRLIVLPDGFDRSNRAEIGRVVQQESATTSDVFIIGTEVYTHLEGALVEHATAGKQSRDAAVFLMVLEREQLQWESNVDFVLADIRREFNPIFDSQPFQGAPPENPFRLVNPKAGTDGGGPGRPLRSGVVDLGDNSSAFGQLYKLSFLMTVNGQRRPIDPDAWCDM